MPVLTDGFSTIYSFALGGGVFGTEIKEKEVTPPGMDGGGPNDTTTMRNATFRTTQPKKLITMTESTFTAAYDPAVPYSTWIGVYNVIQTINVTFPDGSQVDFEGWLNSAKPNAHKEGEQPTMTVQVIPSNSSSNGVEVPPAYTAP